MSDDDSSDTERLKQAVELMEKGDDMECHWSPYCSQESVGYVTAHIGRKPVEVWSCKQCNRSVDTDTEQEADRDN